LKVGIVSDTHDNVAAVAAAVAALRERDVEFVLHAGDVTRPSALAPFADLRVPGALAFGNNDDDREGLGRAARAIGWEAGDSWAGEVGGLSVAVAHGDVLAIVRGLISACPDILVTGHSHRMADELTIVGTRRINPGALHRAPVYSVAVLDTASGALERIVLPKTPRGPS